MDGRVLIEGYGKVLPEPSYPFCAILRFVPYIHKTNIIYLFTKPYVIRMVYFVFFINIISVKRISLKIDLVLFT